jgi:hypothetical protein
MGEISPSSTKLFQKIKNRYQFRQNATHFSKNWKNSGAKRVK